MRLPLQHVGTHQDHQNLYRSESPQEDVWLRLARYGYEDRLRHLLTITPGISDIEKKISYADVRIRQAVEFRQAGKNSSFLTRPLALYYSFLNITRAFLVLKGDTSHEAKRGETHGLSFKRGADLLSSTATISKAGTFHAYLEAHGYAGLKDKCITLMDALGFIIEMGQDTFSIPRGFSRRFTAVDVEVTPGHGLFFRFLNHEGDFKTTWKEAYPSLAEFPLAGSDKLRVADASGPDAMDKASPVVRRFLMPRLAYNQWNPPWYIYRADHPALMLPRIAYYYVAAFILGSVSRYEPQLYRGMDLDNTELGWFFNVFLASADRFFPQLAMMDLHGQEFYFERF